MGRVAALARYPVKSMAGQSADALALGPNGAAADRRWALAWRGDRLLTARVAPRLLAWSARTNGGDGATLTDPDGREWSVTDTGLAAALCADIGKDGALVEDRAGMQDLRGTVLVTFQNSLDALSRELGRPVDVRRFRPNIHVALNAPAFSEAAWEGRRLVVGDVELELLHPCVRCVMVTRDPDTQESWSDLLRHLHGSHSSIFGINARPLGTGTVRVGDPVELAG
jgi:uncharacterized protein YcbX